MTASTLDAPSARLRAQNAAEWSRGITHPLILSTADDSITPSAFARWIVLTSHFLRTYRRFLMVMGTLAPDTRASRLLFQGVQELDEELRRIDEFADGHGLDLATPPSAHSMDYSSYCMASVGQGWARGLVVAFGVESLHLDAWTQAREHAVPEATYRDFIDMWSSDYQAEFVAGVSRLVDRLDLTPELERIFRTTVRLELASWDEAYGLV